ncbi:MAG TPA: DMT family transporter [Planctomycetota bacterium]|nr:DMT family transporter [Planctomycetota bacterium]
MQDSAGYLAAAGTALFWSFTSMFFAAAGRRIGSFTVNQVRIAMALLLLTVMHGVLTGAFWPAELTGRQAAFLVASGVAGLVIGDTLLFRAFVVLGVKRALVIMTLWPALASLLAWPILGEAPSGIVLPAMLVTLSGVALSILARRSGDAANGPPPRVAGILLALGGAICQATGYVLAKPGLAGQDGTSGLASISGTQVRMATAAAILGAIAIGQALAAKARGRPSSLVEGLSNPVAMVQTFGGAFCGPFLGVWLSLEAVKHASIGAATTIMSTAPILVIPWSYFVYGERPRALEWVGAAVAVAGVGLLVAFS